MAARMVHAIPTANANLAGFGAICSPHGKVARADCDQRSEEFGLRMRWRILSGGP